MIEKLRWVFCKELMLVLIQVQKVAMWWKGVEKIDK